MITLLAGFMLATALSASTVSPNYPPFDPTYDYPGLTLGEVPYTGAVGCWQCLPEANESPWHAVYEPPVTPPRAPVAGTPEPAWGALALLTVFMAALFVVNWRRRTPGTKFVEGSMKRRRLKCATCDLWIDLGEIPEEDFERMQKIGVKCGDCVTSAVIDYEEGET